MSKPQHVLIIGFVWPEPDSSAAGQRMMQLVALFQAEGWKVTFASSAAESEHMADLAQLGIDTVSIEINDSEFDTFIRELQPSIVLFDRFVTEEQFGWRVAKHVPNALRIVDTEDLHCLRRARHEAAKEGRPFRKEDLLTQESSKREVASILRSDLSLIISEAEMELLQHLFRVDSEFLYYLPLMSNPVNRTVKNRWPDFKERSHFVTVGNFSHAPNLDAVIYLKNDIWPLIREEQPDAELHIYGAYPTQKVKRLHNPEEGFNIEGRVQDAQNVVRQAKVVLAPLRFGAGLKGKLLEAMQCGTPSITTDVGAEGIKGNLKWSGMIASSAGEIAKAAIELYNNQEKWEQARENGVNILNKRFSSDAFGRALIDKLLQIQQNLEIHRRENFVGRMLLHHTMASTEYMSRWIEEKNKDSPQK